MFLSAQDAEFFPDVLLFCNSVSEQRISLAMNEGQMYQRLFFALCYRC